MAKKTIPQITEQKPLQLLIERKDAEEKINRQIINGEELSNRQIHSQSDLDTANDDKSRWHDFTDELLQSIFSNKKFADEFTGRGRAFGIWGFAGGSVSLSEEIEDYRKNVREYVNKLKSISDRLELIPVTGQFNSLQINSIKKEVERPKVFLVHGHDLAAKESTARFLIRLKLNPIILNEEANQGKTVIEKFEKHSDVSFAVVLLTPDDIGGKDSEHIKPRARQNVIFELGYFISRLGRDKVAALYKDTVELPSDIDGVLYIQMDASDGWHLRLIKEFKQAGLEINLDDLF